MPNILNIEADLPPKSVSELGHALSSMQHLHALKDNDKNVPIALACRLIKEVNVQPTYEKKTIIIQKRFQGQMEGEVTDFKRPQRQREIYLAKRTGVSPPAVRNIINGSWNKVKWKNLSYSYMGRTGPTVNVGSAKS